MSEKRDLAVELTEGTICKQINSDITLTRFNPEYREVMDEALEKWQDFLKTREPDDPVYSFAYWLFRYSGLITPVASLKGDRQEQIIRTLEAEILRLQRLNQLSELGRGELQKAVEEIAEQRDRLQAKAARVDLEIHLYECGHIWPKDNGVVPEECPVCKLKAEAAAMRKALEEIRYKQELAWGRAAAVLKTTTAGADLLMRLEKADRVVEYARVACEAWESYRAAHEPDREIYRYQAFEKVMRELGDALASYDGDAGHEKD
jgi:hypothetical protein